VQNLLIFAKLLQGFARGNVFPEKLKRDCKSAGLGLPGQAKTAEFKGARQQWLLVQITMTVELRAVSRRDRVCAASAECPAT
jgi:hypothetical protein